VWIGLIDVAGEFLSPCSGWQENNLTAVERARCPAGGAKATVDLKAAAFWWSNGFVGLMV